MKISRRKAVKLFAGSIPMFYARSALSQESIPASISEPKLNVISVQERGRVKITDVKVMRIRMRGTYTLIKVETDAGIYGIGEARPDITGLGVKDAVLN